MQWKDVPVGSIIISTRDKFQWKKVNKTDHVLIRNREGNQIYENKGFVTPSHDLTDYIIQTPYGYQSPLWKVLNGESIE